MTNNRLFADDLRRNAAQLNQAPAIRTDDRTITWGQLETTANRLANAFAGMGKQAGSRIGYLGRSSECLFFCLYGAAKSGCVFVPINWRLAPREVAFILEDAGIEVLLVDEEFRSLVDEAQFPNLSILVNGAGIKTDTLLEDLCIDEDDEDPRLDRGPGDTVVQLYTSGTTGVPKGAELSSTYFHAGFVMATTAQESVYDWTSEDAVLVTMPLFHVGGLMFSFLGVGLQSCLRLLRDFDPGRVLQLIDEERVCTVSGAPAMVQMLLDHPAAARTDFSGLRYFFYGASSMPPALTGRAIEVMGCRFAQFYGMTEHTMVTFLPPSAHSADGGKTMTSVGRPVPGVELKIVAENGEELPNGETGEIVIRSHGMFNGYWQRPDATKEAVRDGWFHTGDAGSKDEQGFVYLKDRVKDMIISGGENIYPAEVENVLFEHPAIREVAVVGVVDEKWGEVPKAFVVLNDGADIDLSELQSFAADRLARYKIPKQLQVLEELPKNASQKVLRRVLRSRSD